MEYLPGEEEEKERTWKSLLRTDKLWFGLILGMLAPVLGFYFYYQLQFADHISFRGFIRFVSSPGLLSKVISLAVIMNLPLFFVFIRKHRDRSAQGVLGATIVYAFLIAYLKFFA